MTDNWQGRYSAMKMAKQDVDDQLEHLQEVLGESIKGKVVLEAKIAEQRETINKERELILQQKERIEDLVQDLADSDSRNKQLQYELTETQRAITNLYKAHS